MAALYYRRWLFVCVVGIPAIAIVAEMHDSSDPIWSFVWKVWQGGVVATLAVAVAWIAAGLFERGK
ncbi:MAG TPA: hypothetical protein VG943_09840 [Caulobacterales bacterium]|nr:hypothetical protein [Caulobacterales bacterium]